MWGWKNHIKILKSSNIVYGPKALWSVKIYFWFFFYFTLPIILKSSIICTEFKCTASIHLHSSVQVELQALVYLKDKKMFLTEFPVSEVANLSTLSRVVWPNKMCPLTDRISISITAGLLSGGFFLFLMLVFFFNLKRYDSASAEGNFVPCNFLNALEYLPCTHS